MMHTLDAEYWNRRYLENDFGWDAGAVTTPLKNYFDQLTNKNLRMLIPGAGNAYEAEYLVNHGFTNVSVCDLAEQPLLNLKQRCPAFEEEHLLHIDFFKLQGEFDLIVEQTFFCALDPALRPAYFKKMHALLKPGGRLVGVLFNDALNNNRPPFGGSRQEYEAYFKGSFHPKVFEACTSSIKPREGRELFMILEKN